MKLPAILLVLITLLSGCVGIGAGYVPTFSNKPHSGRPLTRHNAKVIVPGKTTRAEVIRGLGRDYRDSLNIAAIAYPWEMPAGFAFAAGYFEPGVTSKSWELTRWRALFIAFDARGIVTRREIVRLKPKFTLDEQLETWAGWKPREIPPEIVPELRLSTVL